MSTDKIHEGTHLLVVKCPQCKINQEILIGLSGVLKIPTGEAPTLAAKLKAKAVDHKCNQLRLEAPDDVSLLLDSVDPDTGEILDRRGDS